MERNPRHRIGCRSLGRGFQDIQQHPWFSDINWEQLNLKESQPPFVPDVGPRSVIRQKKKHSNLSAR